MSPSLVDTSLDFGLFRVVRPGPRFIKLKRYELVLIAHLHMRIVKIQRVGQSARILPIHVKEGDIRGKSTSFL